MIATTSGASPSQEKRAGHILNAEGEKCHFTQRFEEQSNHFYESMTAITGIIEFDNPRCAKITGSVDEPVIFWINTWVAKQYSFPDANFRVSPIDMHDTGRFQQRGKCLSSEKYPGQAIAIDHIIEDGYLVKVYHAASLGCN